MSRILLEAHGLVKYYGERQVVRTAELLIREGDHIGLVGANGSGKTTLLQMLLGDLSPDAGRVHRFGPVAAIGQLTPFPDGTGAEGEALSRLGVSRKKGEKIVSGGEAVRLRIADALSTPHVLLLCDEPTANLDAEGIHIVCGILEHEKTFLLVSHDRDLLEKYCNRIAFIENGVLTLFDGGFSDWQVHREALLCKQRQDFAEFEEEKRRLEGVFAEKMQAARSVGKKAKKRSASDQKASDFARVNRSYGGKERNLHRAAKVAQERIQRLEAVEKPKALPVARFNFMLTDPPENRIVLRGTGVNVTYGEQCVFRDAALEIPRRARVALCAPNGGGKSTLLGLIADSAQIYRAPKVKIGWFRQDFCQLNLSETVLENAREQAVQGERVVRALLAQLLFREADLKKIAGVLSGGERVKLAFARMLLSPCNLLLLDEPTNYLDLPSIEALQKILAAYEGTMIFVSHDRAFSDALATHTLRIADQRLALFEGNPTVTKACHPAGWRECSHG